MFTSRPLIRVSRAALGAVLLMLPLTVGGCASSSGPVVTSQDVTYDLPPSVRNFTLSGDTVRFDAHGVQFVVVDRRVTLNAIPYGTLEAGDRVRIDPDGRLFVNGTERRPFTPAGLPAPAPTSKSSSAR